MLKYKKCGKCKIKKLIKDFNKSKKYIKTPWCISCIRQYNKEYGEKNKEKLLKQKIEYYYNNKEELNKKNRIYSKKHYWDNPELSRANSRKNAKKSYYKNRKKYIERAKKWRKENPEKMRLCRKIWNENNKERNKIVRKKYIKKNKNKIKEYYKEKRKNDIHYKISRNIGSCLKKRLRKKLINKNFLSTFSFIPYTVNELKQHLEKQFDSKMLWNNYGKKGWHIDHIIPDRFFHYKSVWDDDFQKCWSLSNLRPLWEKDNVQKSGKIRNFDNPKQVMLNIILEVEKNRPIIEKLKNINENNCR